MASGNRDNPVRLKVANYIYTVVVTHDPIVDAEGTELLTRVDHQTKRLILSHHIAEQEDGRDVVSEVLALREEAERHVLGLPPLPPEERLLRQTSNERSHLDLNAHAPMLETLRRSGVKAERSAKRQPMSGRMGILVGCFTTAAIFSGVVWLAWLVVPIATQPSEAITPGAELVRGLIDLDREYQRVETALDIGTASPVISPTLGWAYHAATPYSVRRTMTDGSQPSSVIFNGEQSVLALSLSPDESTLYVLDRSGVIHRRSALSGATDLAAIPAPNALAIVAIGPDRVCWRGLGNTWYLAAPGSPPKQLVGVSKVVAAQSVQGLVVVTQRESPFAEFRDLNDGRVLGGVSLAQGQIPIAFDATDDLSVMVVGLNDGTIIRIFRHSRTQSTQSMVAPLPNDWMALRADIEGHYFAYVSDRLELVDTRTMQPVAHVASQLMPNGRPLGLRWSLRPEAYSVLHSEGVTTWKP